MEMFDSRNIMSYQNGVNLVDLSIALENCKIVPPQELANIYSIQSETSTQLRETSHPRNIGATLKKKLNFDSFATGFLGSGFVGVVSMLGVLFGDITAALTPSFISYADPVMQPAGGAVGFVAGCSMIFYLRKDVKAYREEMIIQRRNEVTLIENNVPKIGEALNIIRNGSDEEKRIMEKALPSLFKEALIQVEITARKVEQRNRAEMANRAEAIINQSRNKNENKNMIPLVGGNSSIQDVLHNK